MSEFFEDPYHDYYRDSYKPPNRLGSMILNTIALAFMLCVVGLISIGILFITTPKGDIGLPEQISISIVSNNLNYLTSLPGAERSAINKLNNDLKLAELSNTSIDICTPVSVEMTQNPITDEPEPEETPQEEEIPPPSNYNTTAHHGLLRFRQIDNDTDVPNSDEPPVEDQPVEEPLHPVNFIDDLGRISEDDAKRLIGPLPFHYPVELTYLWINLGMSGTMDFKTFREQVENNFMPSEHHIHIPIKAAAAKLVELGEPIELVAKYQRTAAAYTLVEQQLGKNVEQTQDPINQLRSILLKTCK